MLKITNTLSKQKENFKPIEEKKVRFYHCGPTVYWVQHIGNLRAMVLADFIRRSLQFLDYEVSFARNYTDVGHLTGDNQGDADSGEDRMEAAAKRDNMSAKEVADHYIAQFERDTDALNILQPDHTLRATEHIQEMIDMVQTLIEKGFAYVTDRAVYFDVSKAKDYTALSGQDLDELMAHAGTGTEKDDEKRNPRDFSLWFFKMGAHQNASQTWPSPFQTPSVENGEGFPGWHIECSAMSKNTLGKTLDIHMGGIEHIPIHHTNEIAQSESANGARFVNYWLHNEHLVVDSKKMAKSEGSSYVLDDITEKGFDPLTLRYLFLGAHYRSKQNFTWDALQDAANSLDKLRERVRDLGSAEGTANAQYLNRFAEALQDDFNTPEALAITWELLKDDSVIDEDKKATILEMDEVLGLGLAKIQVIVVPDEIQKLVDEREEARKKKDWEASDALRQEIEKAGFTVKDTDDGPMVRIR